MWMGGNPPLGYSLPTDPLTRAPVVHPAEAETVRMLFDPRRPAAGHSAPNLALT